MLAYSITNKETVKGTVHKIVLVYFFFQQTSSAGHKKYAEKGFGTLPNLHEVICIRDGFPSVFTTGESGRPRVFSTREFGGVYIMGPSKSRPKLVDKKTC
jgi:hypothetical protein